MAGKTGKEATLKIKCTLQFRKSPLKCIFLPKYKKMISKAREIFFNSRKRY